MFQQSSSPQKQFQTVYIANSIYELWMLEVLPDNDACILYLLKKLINHCK